MKRIWLIALFFCFTASMATAQIRFSKHFGIEGFQDLCADVLVLGDSGYFTVTSSTDFFNIDTLGFTVTSILIVKTNQNGDTVWTKIYKKKNYSIGFNTFTKTNKGYILVGTIIDLVAYENEQKGGYFGIWNLNEKGDTISTRYYDVFKGNDYSTQMIPTLDSGYMVVGQSCNQIQSGANCDFVMMKLDSLGTVNWHKTYSNTSTSFESGYGIVQLPNQDYFLIGYSSQNSTNKTFLVKVNKNGNLLWKKTYSTFPREGGESIVFDNNTNKLYIAGSYNTRADGLGNLKAQIMCVDTNGDLNWKKSFGGPKDCTVNGIVVKNGNIYACGFTFNNDLNNQQGWLVIANKLGDSLTQRLFNVNSIRPHNFYNIQKSSDGFIMSGYSFNTNGSNANQDAWLLKVDTFGCLTPGCQLVGINNIPFSREEIKIYPNPAKDKIQFEHSAKIISYRIADYTGKLLLEGAYNSNQIDVSALPTGAYIVQVLLEDGSQAFGKMVIEL
jgi:Secretion system C-terminal sorting domain